jgi:hypothetical protein
MNEPEIEKLVAGLDNEARDRIAMTVAEEVRENYYGACPYVETSYWDDLNEYILDEPHEGALVDCLDSWFREEKRYGFLGIKEDLDEAFTREVAERIAGPICERLKVIHFHANLIIDLDGAAKALRAHWEQPKPKAKRVASKRAQHPEGRAFLNAVRSATRKAKAAKPNKEPAH